MRKFAFVLETVNLFVMFVRFEVCTAMKDETGKVQVVLGHEPWKLTLHSRLVICLSQGCGT